jgi:hypothetical protein
MPDKDCWKAVETIFETRMMRYVTDGWIFLPKAIMLVKPLFKKADKDLIYYKTILDVD